MSDGKTIFDDVPDHSPARLLERRDPSRRIDVSQAGRVVHRKEDDAASPRAAAWTLPSLPAWGSGVLTLPKRPEPEEADSQEIDFVPAELDDPEPGAPRVPMPYGRESDEAHYATGAALAQFLAQQTGAVPIVNAAIVDHDAPVVPSDPASRATRPLDPVPPVAFNDPPSTPSLSIADAPARSAPRGWGRRIGVAAAGFGIAVMFAAYVRSPASSDEPEPTPVAEEPPIAVGAPAVEAIPVPIPVVAARAPTETEPVEVVVEEPPTDAAPVEPAPVEPAPAEPAAVEASDDPARAIVAACARSDGLEARKIFRTLEGRSPEGRSQRAGLIRDCRKHGVDVSFNGEGHTGPELLAMAKQALQAGKASKAYDLARESSRKDRGTPALQLMGFAACDMGDREKVTYIVNMLRPKDRKAVKARCAKRKR